MCGEGGGGGGGEIVCEGERDYVYVHGSVHACENETLPQSICLPVRLVYYTTKSMEK